MNVYTPLCHTLCEKLGTPVFPHDMMVQYYLIFFLLYIYFGYGDENDCFAVLLFHKRDHYI